MLLRQRASCTCWGMENFPSKKRRNQVANALASLARQCKITEDRWGEWLRVLTISFCLVNKASLLFAKKNSSLPGSHRRAQPRATTTTRECKPVGRSLSCQKPAESIRAPPGAPLGQQEVRIDPAAESPGPWLPLYCGETAVLALALGRRRGCGFQAPSVGAGRAPERRTRRDQPVLGSVSGNARIWVWGLPS